MAAIAGSSGARRLPAPALWLPVLAAGLAVGLVPPLVGAALVAGSVLLLIGVVHPRLPLYLLGLAAPLASVRELSVGGIGVSPTELLVGLALVSFGLALLSRRERESHFSGWEAPAALFVGVVLLSTTWATSPSAAAKELLRWVELGSAFALVVALLRTERQIRTLITVLLLGGLAEGLLGFVQFGLQIGPPSFQIGRFLRAYGTFGQPNPYGGYLGMVLPLALAVAWTYLFDWIRTAPWRDRLQMTATSLRPLAWPLFAGLAFLVTAGGLGASLSRGAWLGTVVGLGALMMAAGRRTMVAVLVGLFVATLVALLGAFDVLPAAAAERIGQIGEYFGVFDVRTVVLSSDNWAIVERMAHWQTAWEMWLDHPWFGIGAGQYPILYEDYQMPGWPDPLGHAHNIYLNVAAEMGAVGLAAYLLMVGSWIALALRTLRLPGKLPRAIGLGVLGAVVMAATHNLFDNLYVAGMNVHVGLLVGLCAAARLPAGDSDAV